MTLESSRSLIDRVVEDALAAEVGLDGAEVGGAGAAAELVGNGDGRRLEGPVADRDVQPVGMGVGLDRRLGAREQALFGGFFFAAFFGFAFFFGGFAFFGFAC